MLNSVESSPSSLPVATSSTRVPDQDMPPDRPVSTRRRKGQKPDLLNRSLLHLAAERGRIDFLKCLLIPGGVVNLRDKRGYTPLHSAVVGGDPSCIRAIAHHGVELDATDKTGCSALDLAVISGGANSAVWLLCLGAKPPKRTLSLKENASVGHVLYLATKVVATSPDAVRDSEIRASLMRKEFAWRSLDTVCKRVGESLQKSTGLPMAVLNDIVQKYYSPFEKARSIEDISQPEYSSSSDEWSSPENAK